MIESDSSVFLTVEDYSRIHHNVSQLSMKRKQSTYSLQTQKVNKDQMDFTHKPEINKKSQNMSRNVNDLYKWKLLHEKEVSIYQQYKQQEILVNASQNRNVQISDTRKSDKNVFLRLCSPSSTKARDSEKSNLHQIKQPTQQVESVSIPYFVQTMSSQQRETYQSGLNLASLQTKQSEPMGSPVRQSNSKMVQSNIQLSLQQTQLPSSVMWKPCLPNILYFTNQKIDQMKHSTIVPTILDMREELKKTISEPEKRLSQLETSNMVDRLNAWQMKKQLKLHSQQEISNQKEIDECTFKPNILHSEYAEPQVVPSIKESQSYQSIFIKKIAKIPQEYR